MKYYAFQHVFDIYCEINPDNNKHAFDLEKTREKFTAIVDAVGIDSYLLKKYKDEQSGEMKKFGSGKSQYCFPETVCYFCAEIIRRYTSRDFKKIRSADFLSVNPTESLFLMEGFTKYLSDLGYDPQTLVHERWKMDRRLHHHINVLKSTLCKACNGIMDRAQQYEQELIYDDTAYFLRHMAVLVDQLDKTIEQTFLKIDEIRADEESEIAQLSARNMEQNEAANDLNQTLLLADALEHDNEYQNLLKRYHEIITLPDFKEKLKGKYNKILAELSAIKERHEIELFGKNIDKNPTQVPTIKHPMAVLADAIIAVEEDYKEQIAREENEASFTKEQISERNQALSEIKEYYEKRGICFDLPNIEEEENDLFLEEEIRLHHIKGTLAFPCCAAEKVAVYKDITSPQNNRKYPNGKRSAATF